MNVAALGVNVIRMPKGQTVRGGDLIESNGDGCGSWSMTLSAVEMRRRHVATITAAVPIETYEDCSHLYPCTLHCG